MAIKRYTLEVTYNEETGECVELIEYVDDLDAVVESNQNRIVIDEKHGIKLDTNILAKA